MSQQIDALQSSLSNLDTKLSAYVDNVPAQIAAGVAAAEQADAGTIANMQTQIDSMTAKIGG